PTGCGDAFITSASSAAGATVVATVAVLLLGNGSNGSLVTLTRLLIRPTSPACPTMVTLAPAPLAKVPSAQVTTPAELVQLPWLEAADMKRRPSGKTSVTAMPVAGFGPK